MHSHDSEPLFITPFNFDDAENELLASDFADAKVFYETIFEKGAKPLGYTKGNGATTVQYKANGEASDWMLGERGIYAISPEISILGNKAAKEWFIKDPEALREMLVKNYTWIELIFMWFVDPSQV